MLAPATEDVRNPAADSQHCRSRAGPAASIWLIGAAGTATRAANNASPTKHDAPGSAQREVLTRLRAEQRDPAHGGQAGVIRGAKNAAHQAAVRDWAGERPDPAVCQAEIQPALRDARISDLVAATNLSEHYCSLIRLGRRIPHPALGRATQDRVVSRNG